MDTTSHLPGKSQGTKHAKQSVWSAQQLDQQSNPSVTRPVGDVASTTDAAHVEPKQAVVDSKAGNNKSPFGIGQTLRPIFVYSRDDLGFAQMFHRRFGHYFRFDHERGQWLAWDVRKKRWVTGRLATTIMMRFVKKVITKLYSLAQSRHPLRTRNGETVTPEEALAWAKSASQKSRQKAMLELVRDFAGVRVSKDELDSDPFLLGVANGVVDHRTGTLIENRPELLITRYAKASYLPDANAEGNKASNFQRSIGQICLGRQDLVDFLQEVFGYSLSGLIKEHAFFLLVGTGANGKSTLVETFLYLLGDYGVGMPSHAFLKSNSRAIRNDIARLPGIRFAACAEVNTGMCLDESMVKRATGGDVMTARFIGKEYFDFHPQAKFIFSVNTLPKVTGADNGIYRRLIVIPFDGDFQATMDRDLPEKLRNEINGILAWAVEGFQRWYKRGHLVLPDCVVDACNAYRSEMDTVKAFLDDMCSTGDSDALTPLGVLYESYRQWAKGSLVEPASLHLFGTLMVQKGFKKVKSGTWRWKGVALKTEPKPASTVSPFGMTTPQPTPADTESSSTVLPQ